MVSSLELSSRIMSVFGKDEAVEQLRIFVSHSSQDKDIAGRFVHGLRKAGAEVWYDEHSLGAGDLSDEIQRELESRSIFIVLLSKAAFASKWVRRETKWATELKERDSTRVILPVVVQPIERTDFNGVSGWLFLHDLMRVDNDYQPYPIRQSIKRTLGILNRTHEMSIRSQSQSQENIDELVVKALFAQSNYAGAIPFLKRITEQNPTRYEVWVDLGLACYEEGCYDDALQAYQHALALDASNAKTWYNKGLVLVDMKQYEEALAAFDQALAINPSDVETWDEKGEALHSLKRYEEALISFDQALNFDPTYESALMNKGDSLYRMKRYEEALSVYEYLLKRGPTSEFYQINKGYALMKLRRYEDALATYEQMLSLDQDDTIAWMSKGDALLHMQQYNESIVAYEQALMLRQQDTYIWTSKGTALSNLGPYHCHSLAQALRAVGRTAEAESAERQATPLGYS